MSMVDTVLRVRETSPVWDKIPDKDEPFVLVVKDFEDGRLLVLDTGQREHVIAKRHVRRLN